MYALSWVQVLALVATLGLDTASLRFLAGYRTERRWAQLRGFLRRSLMLVAGTSFMIAAFLAMSVWLAASLLRSGLVNTFLVAAVLLPGHALLLLAASQLRGLKRIVRSMLPASVLRPVVLAAVAGLLYLVAPGHVHAPVVMALEAATTAALLVVSLVWLRRARPAASRQVPPRYLTRSWLAVSLPLLAVTGVRFSMNRTDILLVGVYLGTEPAGVYTAASQLATLIGFGLLAVNMIAAPLFAELWARGDRRELQRIVRWSARGIFVFSLGAGIFLLLLGKPLLGVFGPRFVSGYGALTILVCSQIVSSLAGSVGFLLSMTGEERVAARVTVATGVINVALNAGLIPLFGLLGAAAATATANVLWNLSLVLVVKRRLGLSSLAFGGLRSAT